MKIGYNQVCINPTFSCLPVGFLSQTQTVNKVRGDLFARCVRFEDENTNVVLITFDSLGLSEEVQFRLTEALRPIVGKDTTLLFSCSHTHFAPSLTEFLQIKEDVPYLESLDIKLINLVRNCRMSEDADYSVSYQSRPFNEVGKTRLSSGSDEYVRASVLSFFKNKLRIGNFLIYNCHPTISAEDCDYLSPDYPGASLEFLKQHYPKEFFVFLQGPCGDVSTRYTRTSKSYDEVIRLGNELAIFWESLMKLTPRTHELSLAVESSQLKLHKEVKEVNTKNLDITAMPQKEKESLKTAEMLVESLKKELPQFPDTAEFVRVNFGPFRFVFNPFELFSAYTQYIDVHKEALICYTQGLMSYLTLPNNKEYSYEAQLEIASEQDKEEVVKLIQTL